MDEFGKWTKSGQKVDIKWIKSGQKVDKKWTKSGQKVDKKWTTSAILENRWEIDHEEHILGNDFFLYENGKP